jgi:hypothetical protein
VTSLDTFLEGFGSRLTRRIAERRTKLLDGFAERSQKAGVAADIGYDPDHGMTEA